MKLYEDFKKKMSKVADIGHAAAVLSWDKEVYLPKNSAAIRSQQMATLMGIAHGEFTDKEFGILLNKLEKSKSLSDKEQRNVKITLEEYNKATLFTQEFVIKKSQIISEVYHAWIEAKNTNNFDIYAEPLNKLIALKKEESKILNKGDHPYDALLDQYEPNLTVKKLDSVFSEVKMFLPTLIETINEGRKVDDKFLFKKFNKDKQWDFGLYLLKNMGYDFDRGRQDIAPHPFTISFGVDDVRVTTRIDEKDFSNMTWSCIHEGGHALYEQGLDSNEYGLPSGSAISLAIHESQSRLWENNVGRSKAYWEYHYPVLQKKFKKQLSNIGLKQFYRAINKVTPGFIRTEADELHYHLHVLIRYEIEKTMMEENIDAYQIRDLWNEKYKEYLGVDVIDDRVGILQDVHWAHGSFGYFPTYSLGSFYAAQFYQQAEKDIPDLTKLIKKGDTSQLLKWLRENIHIKGRSIEADELCKAITGEDLNFDYFKSYVERKYLKLL